MIMLAAIVWLAAAAPNCDAHSREMVRQCFAGHWPTGEQIFGPACNAATRRLDRCERLDADLAKPCRPDTARFGCRTPAH